MDSHHQPPKCTSFAFLRGIEVLACHGVDDEERHRPQRFVVDVRWWLELEKCARAAGYAEGVGYEAVFQAVVGVVSGPQVHPIEELPVAIIDALFQRFAAIRMVKVSVRKPDAPMPGQCADLGSL
jgi:dihydroneopterin aldolase